MATQLSVLKQAYNNLRAAADDLEAEIAEIEAGNQTCADSDVLFGARCHAKNGLDDLTTANSMGKV